MLDSVEIKYILSKMQRHKENPRHDDHGRFAAGGGNVSSSSWQEKYHKSAGAGIDRYSQEHGVSPEEYTKTADEHVHSLVSEANPWTRMHEASLVSMLNDGRFKSQFETKASSGLISEKQRMLAEENLYNTKSDSAPEQRTIYGYMSEHPDGVVARDTFQKQYGGVAVSLKEDVREHTSVTGGDSLNATFAGTNAVLLPKKINTADHEIFDYMNDPLRFKKASEVYPYLEAQYHGGLKSDAIKEVVFHAQPESSTLKLLDEKKIPYRFALQPLVSGKKPKTRTAKKEQTVLRCLAMLPSAPGWYLMTEEQDVSVVDTLTHTIYPPMNIASLVARDPWEPHNATYRIDASYHHVEEQE